MIGAEFLGMIMLIVYVGAVAVLFLFVVMMLNVAQQKINGLVLQRTVLKHIPIGIIISAIIFFELIIVIGGWKYKPDVVTTISLNIDSTMKFQTHIPLGYVLYTDYIHIFQLSGMILLVAMIGAIVLTLEKDLVLKDKVILVKYQEKDQKEYELIDVESNKESKSDD